MSEHIKTEVQDNVITIRLNRPEKKNALTSAMYGAIADALELLENDPALRAGLITGTPECFTAGNDLIDFLQGAGTDEGSPVSRFLNLLPNLSKPLVAAMNGPVVGVGTTMLFHCDLAYATPTAQFQMPFVKLGLCPEAGSSLLLTETVGYRRATELLILGETFSAEEAKSMGIINQVVEADHYQTVAFEKAKQLAALPPSSVRITKKLMRQSYESPLKNVMDAELKYFGELLNGAESKEAINAFLEKRKPDFSQFS